MLLEQIQQLIRDGDVQISRHGFLEMESDQLHVSDILAGALSAQVVEEYPEFHKGPCVLVLQTTASGEPIHILWGIPRDQPKPAVLITAYRPDASRWSPDFRRRLK